MSLFIFQLLYYSTCIVLESICGGEGRELWIDGFENRRRAYGFLQRFEGYSTLLCPFESSLIHENSQKRGNF